MRGKFWRRILYFCSVLGNVGGFCFGFFCRPAQHIFVYYGGYFIGECQKEFGFCLGLWCIELSFASWARHLWDSVCDGFAENGFCHAGGNCIFDEFSWQHGGFGDQLWLWDGRGNCDGQSCRGLLSCEPGDEKHHAERGEKRASHAIF